MLYLLMKRLLLILFLLLTANLPTSAAQRVPFFRFASSSSSSAWLDPRCDSLTLRANIYYGDQDEEAVAVQADFYLLDASIVEILKAAKFEPVFPDGKKHRIADDDYLATLAAAFASADDGAGNAEAETLLFLINEPLTAHRRRSAAVNVVRPVRCR